MFLLKLKISDYVQHDLGFDPFSLEAVLYFYVKFYFVNLWTFNPLSENEQKWLLYVKMVIVFLFSLKTTFLGKI